MGNIGSHSGQTAQRQPEPEPQWAHSFPRNNPPRLGQHKVLPERDALPKLRPTNNGEILHSGGTLSGRHQQHRLSLEREREDKHPGVYRSTSIATTRGHEYHENKSQSPLPVRSYLSNQRDPFHKSGHRYEYKRMQNGFSQREQMKRFGSEPNLRNLGQGNDGQEAKDKLRGKKKYKAPAPPNNYKEKLVIESGNNSSNSGNISPARRPRLFKTRAEMKKKQSSPANKRRSLEYNVKLDCVKRHATNENGEHENDSPVQFSEHEAKINAKNNRLSLPEMRRAHSTPEFQQELKEATRRLLNAKLSEDNQKEKQKIKTLDHNINKKENIRNKFKQIEQEKENKRQQFENVRGEAAGKDSSPEQSPQQNTQRERKENEQPKTFYFGMDSQNNIDKLNYTNNIIEHFTTSLHTMRVPPVANSSESDISSELDMEDSQTSSKGIALQLRPILPKKQLEIPRFSPAAAWRLLTTMEANHAPSTVASDDGPVFIEERIEKLSRPPPPPTVQLGPRSSHDKSGDSGISGDAGPPGFDDSPEGIVINQRNSIQIARQFGRSQGISWTPQQDLGDDSSLEEGLNNNSSYTHTKFSTRAHVFSLSLPRDNQLAAYMGEKSMLHSYTGLQKLKRSVSGVLGSFGNKKDFQANPSQDQSDNWFLSRSAPNSLNNGFNSLEIRHSQKSDEQDQSLVPNSKHNMGRLMYLPEFDSLCQEKQRESRKKNKNDLRDRSKSVERSKSNYKLSTLSKSCENITGDVKSSSEPEDLQDPPKQEIEKFKGNKPKRFTFQSTVRQIERKRLAEKLSKEAERKEKQRLRELEAMQRVEEEFQRKRAREKASIRQQLRLFSMDDTVWSNLPPNVDIKGEVPARSEPDGAVSSSTNSTPSLPLDKSTKQSKKGANKTISPRPLGKYASSSESSEDIRIKAPATQVLSEYRQPQREYKEYRGGTRYLSDYSESHVKQTMVYPQVTCNMPKAKGHQASNNDGTSNYRKDFAHGVKSNKSGGSSYSEDSQPNTRNQSPRMYHNKYSPITRF